MSGADRPAVCARSWEVEAARDGRLSHKDLEGLRRHLTTCAFCRVEQQRLDALGETLRRLPPLPDDVVAARRMRHQLLADVNRLVIEPAPVRRRVSRVALASALGALALLTLAAGHWLLRSRASQLALGSAAASSASQSSSEVHVEITAHGDAHWQKRQLGDELRIELEAGEISATIGQRRPGQLVRIQLPDGWIDDLGTVLSVQVEEQRTLSVHVFEGRVRLRLDGRDPVELGAGDNWTAAPVAIASGAAIAPAPIPSPARTHLAGAQAVARPPTAATATHAGTATQVSGAQSDATTDSATARLAREEDEAYLHIVSLARAHQLNEARAAAKDYLLRFPNGFRREEVLGVATR